MVRYLAIVDALRSQLQSGQFAGGRALPSEAELCDSHKVSRTTIRAALEVLRAEGLIRTHQGRGTFVEPKFITKDLGSLVDFNTEAEQLGRRPTTRVLALTPRPATITERAIFGGEVTEAGVLNLVRLRLIDAVPAVLQTSILALSIIGPVTAADLEHSSLYRFLSERRDVHVEDLEETLEPAVAAGEVAEHLDILPGTAVFRSARLARDASARIVEVSDNVIRGDLYRFKVRRRLGQSG